MSVRYRPEIDGLRSVALLPVVIFHAGLGLPGGYVGVDVFFVISGFLIGSILMEERARTGKISILNFYERRARRILPALVFVILACVPFAWLWMLPSELDAFGRSIVATIAFASNILFWSESGYFDQASELKPLLHTWSLAVEEQYYIVFPLFVAFVWRVGRYWFGLALGIAILTSLFLAEWASYNRPVAAFYWLPTRAWELLAGAMLAFWTQDRDVPRGIGAEMASLVGLAGILWGIFAFDATTRWPGFLTVIPVTGVILVIWFGGATFTGRLLSWRPLVWIGLISYSAYLWHQPIFAFARLRFLNEPSHLVMSALSLLTLGLAWFSWYFVERPFRDRGRFSRRQVFCASLVSMTALLSLGINLHLVDGAPKRLPSEALAAYEVSREGGGPRFSGEPLVIDGIKVALLGDSHARLLFSGVADRLETTVANFTASACQSITGVATDANLNCKSHNAKVMQALDSSDVELVIMAGRWPYLIEGTRFDNGIGGVEAGKPSVVSLNGSLATRVNLAAALRQEVGIHVEAGRHVIVVLPVPEMGWNVPLHEARAKMIGVSTNNAYPRKTADARRASTLEALRPWHGNPKVTFIDPITLVCDATNCHGVREGRLLFRDAHHLSSASSDALAAEVARAASRVLE